MFRYDFLSCPKESCREFLPVAGCDNRYYTDFFRKKILSGEIKPSDENARQALLDPEYYEFLDKYDKKLWKLTDPLWEETLKKKY